MNSLFDQYKRYQEIELAYYKAKKEAKKELLKRLNDFKIKMKRLENPEYIFKKLLKSRGYKNGKQK